MISAILDIKSKAMNLILVLSVARVCLVSKCKIFWEHILLSFMEIREGFFFELCEVIMPCMCFIMLVRPGCSNYNNFLLSVTSSFVVINTKIKRNRAISENNISLHYISLLLSP